MRWRLRFLRRLPTRCGRRLRRKPCRGRPASAACRRGRTAGTGWGRAGPAPRWRSRSRGVFRRRADARHPGGPGIAGAHDFRVAVVSKPEAKNTRGRPGWARAMAAASRGEAIGRISAPAARAWSSERISPFGTLAGTRSMSPNATRVMVSRSASWIAWWTSSSGQTQTGQPEPGMSSRFSGSTARRPAMVRARSWPPHTFMILNLPCRGSARIRFSQTLAGVLTSRGRFRFPGEMRSVRAIRRVRGAAR